MARLIVKTDDRSDTIDLSPTQPVTVGRDAENQIALENVPGVSRQHCRITAVQSGGGLAYELSDLGATNKTRVNGKPTDKRMLSSGDVIMVGKAEITFEDEKEDERLKEAGGKGLCYLEWVSGDRKGEKVWLDASRTTIGRRPSNTIPLDDRMSSGHHAEVARDLNGYTIRDMGSTNGTLVNGEPLTEATLNHGSRIRIGNSRFVFKDPSMKDIEVELSQFDEDEGWGMMGDIDLSRARGSYLGLLLGVLLLAGAAGGGYFLMTQAEQEKEQLAGSVETNLVEDGDMEDEDAVSFLWEADRDDAPVTIRTTKRGKGLALSIRHTGGDENPAPVVVSYADEFPALASEPLRLRASFRPSGDAALVAVWRNKADAASGVTGLTHTIASRAGGSIDITSAKPKWADLVAIGVRVGPGGSAILDDVRVTRTDAGRNLTEVECPGDPKAWLHPDGGLDIMNGLTVLIVGAKPVAMVDGKLYSDFETDGAGGGTSVSGTLFHGEDQKPVTISWGTSESGDGLEAKIECAGATAVGLDTPLLRAHLSAGVNVLTSAGKRSIAANAGETLKGVERTLGGDAQTVRGRPRTLITIAPQGESSANTLELHDATDTSQIIVRHWTEGASAAFAVVTDYDVQARAANDELNNAESLVRREPGRGIEQLRKIATLYPFNERVHNRAISLADESEGAARKELDGYRGSLQRFRIFRSADTLADLDEWTKKIRDRYPSRGEANGQLENTAGEIDKAAADARAAYYAEHAGAELTRLERLADLLADVDGYKPMAAIFYRTIVDRFGHLEGDDSFGRRVARAKTRFEELTKDATVAAAVPKSAK